MTQSEAPAGDYGTHPYVNPVDGIEPVCSRRMPAAPTALGEPTSNSNVKQTGVDGGNHSDLLADTSPDVKILAKNGLVKVEMTSETLASCG